MVRQASLLFVCAVLSVTSALAQQAASAQAPPPVGSPADLVKQGQQLSREGRQDDALVLYNRALDLSPDLFEANLASGMALDLKGDYAQAQEHFAKALEKAPADSKQQTERSIAVSYTFSGDAFKAAQAEVEVFKERMAKSDQIGSAEICDELGRIYLELGDPDHAYKWYKLGYDTANQKADLSDADKSLWLFRWESAQARIAVRRQQPDEARQHVLAAKAALDRANNPDQMRFYPYLTGYVALYSGDSKTAINDLQKADQRDPFILALLAQAYEKSGDSAQARDYYRKVLDTSSHNLTAAFARPLAMKKLAGTS
ncbi:MAG TPA: tetratricopeptide repeat protein [Verrucomicrobiae bacterium]|nr:tetratricopeptide repeat protein [Verrucomicrobiae bacterium]